MTYSPTIPTDLPPPNIAVDSLRTNFAQYATNFKVNHVALNDSNQGKHANIILENQTIDPGVIGTYDAVYTKSVTSASSTSQQLFLQVPQFLPNAQPNLPMQLTFNSVNIAGPQYQTFLPGGYIMYFGKVSAVPVTITLVPAPTKIVCAIANPNNFTSVGTAIPFDVSTNVISASQFTIKSLAASGVYTFTWIAIAQA